MELLAVNGFPGKSRCVRAGRGHAGHVHTIWQIKCSCKEPFKREHLSVAAREPSAVSGLMRVLCFSSVSNTGHLSAATIFFFLIR